MAALVVNLHLSPSDYWALTGHEREALVKEFNRVHKKQ